VVSSAFAQAHTRMHMLARLEFNNKLIYTSFSVSPHCSFHSLVSFLFSLCFSSSIGMKNTKSAMNKTRVLEYDEGKKDK
jgi:hypothetical protein